MKMKLRKMSSFELGAVVAAVLVAGAVGCDGRELPVVADAGYDGAAPARPDGALSHPDRGLRSDSAAPPACVVAIRVDDCCTQAYPEAAERVAADPCLVAWPMGAWPAECMERWPEECDYVDCTFTPPPSRLAEPGPAGSCAWASECATDEDCQLATNLSECCACPAIYPLVMIEADRCLHDYRLNTSGPTDCAEDCSAVKCWPCSQPPPSGRCVDPRGDGLDLSVCQE